MKKQRLGAIFAIGIVPVLAGCGPIGEKAASISIVYGCAVILSLLLLLGYCWVSRKPEVWFLLLFAAVLVVNIGYCYLSVSRNLTQALWANRIAYLGSVFLPMVMLMILFQVTGIRCSRWLQGALVVLGILVFLVAASPGYLDIYYKEVFFETVGGVSALRKVYGPWHVLYLFYLLGYFCVMIAVLIHAVAGKKMDSPVHAVILAAAVFANIGVWLLEQLVEIHFEILSLSYIISELFLLGLDLVMQENARLKQTLSHREEMPPQPEPQPVSALQIPQDICRQFLDGLPALTRTERAIYECYIAGKTTKQILAELNIKENTLKFHNKNLYGKLGVSSRKQLIEIHKSINADKESV